MIDTVFGIKVRMSGLCINRYRPIVRRRSICESWLSQVQLAQVCMPHQKVFLKVAFKS